MVQWIDTSIFFQAGACFAWKDTPAKILGSNLITKLLVQMCYETKMPKQLHLCLDGRELVCGKYMWGVLYGLLELNLSICLPNMLYT